MVLVQDIPGCGDCLNIVWMKKVCVYTYASGRGHVIVQTENQMFMTPDYHVYRHIFTIFHKHPNLDFD